MVKNNIPIFSENQKFSKLLLWILSADAFFFIGLFLFLTQYLQKKQHIQPTIIIAIAVIWIIPIAISILFGVCKLQIKVCSDGLYVRFFPIHIKFKKFVFDDISQYYAREYRPVLEYGGWGIKFGFGGGKAYNISGNKGMQIVFKNGKKLLIGSQNPEKLVAAIDSILKK